jgi:hypothetical protein
MRVATPALFAAGFAMLSPLAARAQCSSSLLSLPFCIAGAAVNTATAIATAPFRSASGYSYYRPSYYYGGTRHYHSVRYYYGNQHHTHHYGRATSATAHATAHHTAGDLAVSDRTTGGPATTGPTNNAPATTELLEPPPLTRP